MKRIQSEVDKQFKMVRINRLDENELEKKNEKINKEIKVKEKEIVNSIREIEIFKKEKESLEKVLNVNNEEKQYILLDQLNELQSQNNLIEKELKLDNEKLKVHKLCVNKTKNLLNQLNLLRNELEFEKKKTSFSEFKAKNSTRTVSQDLEYLDELSIENKKLNKNFGKKINNKKNNGNSLQKLTTPIWKELEISNKNNIKNLYSKNKSTTEILKTENDRVKYGLFSPKEFDILVKIIPEEKLNVFRERYDNLEMEKYEVEDLFHENQPIKNNIQKNQFKINKSEFSLKIKNKNKQKINNYSHKMKTLASDLGNEIKIIKEQLKKYKSILKGKMNENLLLKKHIKDMKIKMGIIDDEKENENENQNENNKINEKDNSNNQNENESNKEENENDNNENIGFSHEEDENEDINNDNEDNNYNDMNNEKDFNNGEHEEDNINDNNNIENSDNNNNNNENENENKNEYENENENENTITDNNNDINND